MTDTLDDGTTASVSCPSTTVAANTNVTCTYSAAPGGRTATLNNATITSNTSGVGGTSAQAPLNWNATVTGDESRTLTDDRFPTFSQVISAEGPTSVTLPESFTCSSDPSRYTNGALRTVEDNTATLAGSASLTATASVTIDCTLAALTASKTAAGSYDRVVTWDLAKSVDDDAHSGQAGQIAGTSLWTVTATKTVANLNHAVTGAITIGNPASIAQTFTVQDVLDSGATGVVDCPALTVPAGGEVVCTYTASGAGATLNTATVTAPGNAPVNATAAVTYTPNTIGTDEVTLADPRFPAPNSQVIDRSTTITYEEDFTCSSVAAHYTNGANSRTETNTATLTGTGVNLTATKTVTVDCTLPSMTAVKTAVASYDNTISWTLAKTVDPSSHSGYFGQVAGTSIWTVVADRTDTPGNYRVTGDIVITNPSAIDVPFSVTDALNDTTAAAVTCDQPQVVPAGESVTCTYVATPTDASATLNTATVDGTGNAPFTATAVVTFTRNDIGDTSVTLADPRFSSSQVISADATLTFPEPFLCSSNWADYTNGSYSRTEVNTATLTGGDTDLSRSAQVTIDCRGYDETATGAGTQWPGTSNWFMYTPFSTKKVDLIAGQHHDAGDITMVKVSKQWTDITVTLHDGFVMAPVPKNVKIIDMAKAPTAYVQPGAFPNKFTQSGQTFTVRVPTASFYGIHLDVIRLN